jgi:hypothetical protein
MKNPHTMKNRKHENLEAQQTDAFQLRKKDDADQSPESEYHYLGPGIICDTGSRGYAMPHGRSAREIFVNAPEGFIPLWEKDTILHWRFQERSFDHFLRPEAAEEEVKKLLGDALMEWGTAAPVKFTEDNDLWDFEIVMKQGDECNPSGCVLASAFFPDSGRHELVLYPRMFTQSRKEQVDTFIHELGHVFGLRHFFADISETEWPAEHFGKRRKFSIMNYGALSELTKTDTNWRGRVL